ncbi:putative DNA helicase [Helianthus annuus]|nr:putative DNA helicase [Helianthus annuus]
MTVIRKLRFNASCSGSAFVCNNLREIRASTIGQLVKISGIVAPYSNVKPLMKVFVYTCEECGFEIYQEVTAQVFMPLFECPSKRC